MIKITLLVSALLVLSSAFVLQNGRALQGCLYPNEVWGSQDGTKFYFCLPGTDIAVERPCEEGTFFVRNATVSGCLPLDQVNSNCVNSEVAAAAPTCTGNALRQPQPSSDPTKFYLCTGEGATPIEKSCPEGKVFLEKDGYLGCFDWERWRDVRDCPE